MSKEDMIQARELIKQKRFDEARAVLRATNHQQAVAWLKKLDEIDPPQIDPEATLIERSPAAVSRELPPAMATPEDRAEKKSQGEIPMPVAIGLIGLVVLIGVCIIGGIIVFNSLQQTVLNNPVFVPLDSGIDPPAANSVRPIAYGESAAGNLNAGNDYEEVWRFDASEGDRVTITMRSGTIDAILYLYSAEGDYLTTDDDSGLGENGFDALIEYTIPDGGQYLIYANQWLDIETGGPYTLSLQRN